MRGKFIVIEGLDGSGKSTAVQYVVDLLNQHGIKNVITTREPGGTPLAEKLRQIIKSEQDLNVKAELLMLYASRVQLVENLIQPALNQGVWVVGDRHDWSSLAYQGGGRGIDLGLIQSLRRMVLGDFKADFTMYLDIEPRLGVQRATGRSDLDRFERQELDFFERSRAQYLDLVKNSDKAVCINANLDLPQVHRQIKSALETFLNSQS